MNNKIHDNTNTNTNTNNNIINNKCTTAAHPSEHFLRVLRQLSFGSQAR